MAKEIKTATLPEGITQEMIDEAKGKYSSVKLASLSTGEGEYLEDIVVHTPSAFVMTEFEKQIDRNSYKAKALLIKGCVLGEARNRIAALPNNEELFNAAFSAAAEMLPIGKATLKNL